MKIGDIYEYHNKKYKIVAVYSVKGLGMMKYKYLVMKENLNKFVDCIEHIKEMWNNDKDINDLFLNHPEERFYYDEFDCITERLAKWAEWRMINIDEECD